MPRIWLIGWQVGEVASRATVLRRAGFTVDTSPLSPAAVRTLRALPAAFAIDLSRAPSRGRDTGLFLRQRAATRPIPLVFLGGEPEAVRTIRRLLPDAVFSEWTTAPAAIRRAIARPPAAPVTPGVFAPFAGTPLARKLGIRPQSVVALINAPPGFEASIGRLPPDVRLRWGRTGRADLTLWFVRSRRELEAGLSRMAGRAADAGLWILWPKRADGARPDVNQIVVRRTALATGLVDFKIASVDARWSGLRFATRRAR